MSPVEAYDEPVDLPSTPFVIETLAFAPEVKPVIEKVDTSPYIEQEKAKSLAQAKRRVVRQTTTKTSVSTTVPGVYGNACSCVLFAKAYSGKNPGSVGYARNWPVNSNVPVVGAVGKTNESWAGHVFVVTAINSDGTISVIEGNLSRCRVTTRKIPINSPIIRGYYL